MKLANQDVIRGVLDAYSMARGNSDVEYVLVEKVTPKGYRYEQTIEADSEEYEEFTDDAVAYYNKRGWTLNENKLSPITPDVRKP